MAVQLEYQGKSYSKSENARNYEEKYVGTFEDASAYFNLLVPKTYVADKGYINNITLTQKEGNLWNVNISYGLELSSNGTSEDSSTGAQQNSLSCGRLSLALEMADDYLCNWNYYLIARGEYATAAIPAWYNTAKDTFISAAGDLSKNYRWIKSLSEIPTEADAENKYWSVIKYTNPETSAVTITAPKKPGVESFDKPTYTITEYSRYASKTKAGWATASKLNKIFASPPAGDFGLNLAGNWKLDDAQIYYDGKKWVSQCTYTASGNSQGWDTDLYAEME